MRFIQTVLALVTFLFIAVDASSTRWAVAETCQADRVYKNSKNCCCAPRETVIRTEIMTLTLAGRVASRRVNRQNDTVLPRQVHVAHICPICPKSGTIKIWTNLPRNAQPCCLGPMTRTLTSWRTTRIPPKPTPVIVLDTKQTVPALDVSGVGIGNVQAGDVVTISATGTWCMGGSGHTAECGSAAGIRYTNPDEPANVLPTAKIGRLIARIGSGPWFDIGATRTFTANRSGMLMLLFNDIPGRYGDNSQSVTAHVRTTR
jgi:hypothetical protein